MDRNDREGEAARFLGALFGRGAPGLVSLWCRGTKRSSHLPAASPGVAAAAAVALDEGGEDVYFGCGLRRADLGPRRRGKAGDVGWLGGAWLDLDLAGPGHAAENLPRDVGEALQVFAAVPDPTFLLHSGGGLHAWWAFDELLEVGGEWPRQRCESLLLAVEQAARVAAAARGWHLDSVADLARVLRLPGTRNRKIEGSPREVVLLDAGGPRWRPEDLESALARPAAQRQAAPAPPAAVDQAAAGAPPPPGASQLAVAEARQRLAGVRDKRTRPLAELILSGGSIAPRGRRDAELQRACSLVAFLCPEHQAADLAEVLWPCLTAWAAEEGAGKTLGEELRKAEEKLGRALEDAKRKRAEQAEAERLLEEALIRAASEGSGQGGGDSGGGGAPPPAGGDPAQGPRPAPRRGKYDEEELAAFAARLGCPPEELARRWIIQKGQAFFVLVEGRYQRPLTREELPVSLRRDLAPSPVKLVALKADGTPRRRSVEEILLEHATVARELVADLTIQESRYEPATQTFREAVCPLRPIAPRHHERIDQWLRLLGGPEQEKLLDWVASVTDLRQPSCALYLSGAPGAGKGMLGLGLARLWTRGGWTELRRVLDAWTADIARCPVIVADESLPQQYRGQKTSAELRAMIGRTGTTLTRKHLPNSWLEGACRVMLLANNDRLLALGEHEDLGADDLAAVAGRFLHVEYDWRPGEFLRQIGGRRATDGWVAGDQIAEHALWLRDNREVRPGERFVVEGTATHMHRKLAAQTKVAGLAIEWIARYLGDPHQDVRASGLVRVGGGEVLVNTTALVDYWGIYVKSDDVPTTARLGTTLSNLRTREVRIGNVRFHAVDPRHVLEWAADKQVGDVEKMRAAIEAPAEEE